MEGEEGKADYAKKSGEKQLAYRRSRVEVEALWREEKEQKTAGGRGDGSRKRRGRREQLGKMNQDVNGNKKLFWKEVSKAHGGKVENSNRLKDEKGVVGIGRA